MLSLTKTKISYHTSLTFSGTVIAPVDMKSDSCLSVLEQNEEKLSLLLKNVIWLSSVFFVWRNKRREKLQSAPMEAPKEEKKEPKAKLVKAGPLAPEESKIPMQIIMCKGDGKERSCVGIMNVLPSIRLRELRYRLSDNFPSLKEKRLYFLSRQLCDIEPAAEQQQFVSLVF